MSALLEAALARARDGEPVLPVWWTDAGGRCACGRKDGCKPGKHPLTANGFYDASLDLEEIARWYKQWPQANIGARTDERPRIDVDLLEAAQALRDDVALPQTTELVLTPSGGLHIGLATGLPVPSRVLHLSDGRRLGELKAARAYVLVPPSVIGGRAYTKLSPSGVSPLRVEDPVVWLGRLLEPFGLSLRLAANGRRDYEALAGTIHEGDGRHNAVVSFAGKVHFDGMSIETLIETLEVMNQRQCRPPLPHGEVVAIAEHRAKKSGSANGHHDDAIVRLPNGDALPTTDAGNGELFAQLYGDRLRYDHRRRCWLIWKGHWWADDQDGEARRLAKTATRHRYLTAASIESLDRRAATAKFAIASENRQRLDAMLAQAQSEPPIADAGDCWNADGWALAVANGVVDLRTGRLRPGRPEDRITFHTEVPFVVDARCPRWLQFLDEVFRSDKELIDFIWRAVGYCLTGDTREQCLFVCYGTGANGKSAFLSILRAIVGLYGFNAPFSIFELERKSSIPNDLAALGGRRLVTSSETNEGTRLNEARIKALTGCDPITARFLHGEFFTFDPVAKYWLAVNHRPVVTDDSYGFWRRVRLIPFLRVFRDAQADPRLGEALAKELPGILAWAVRGALAWQEHGLIPPPAVRTATETYRVESDPLAQFLGERCLEGEGYEVGATAIYKAYCAWSTEQAMSERERLTSTAFGNRMTARFEKKRSHRGNVYRGVGLFADDACDEQGRSPKEDGGVQGSVQGFESAASVREVSSLENSLSRENLKEPYTTLHTLHGEESNEREPCAGGCGQLVPRGRKCSPCADTAVQAWKEAR